MDSSLEVGMFFSRGLGGGGGWRNSSKVPRGREAGCRLAVAVAADEIKGSAHGSCAWMDVASEVSYSEEEEEGDSSGSSKL